MQLKKTKRIYIYGSDGVGWSIDSDYAATVELARNINNIDIVNSPIRADIIHFVWYTQALRYARILNFFKKVIIVSVTNNIKEHQEVYKKLKKYVDVWVCANDSQANFLISNGHKVVKHPYYINEKSFVPISLNKCTLSKYIDIDYDKIKGKYLIGSFQRDSLGDDLSKPKRQKNPEKMMEIIRSISGIDFVLLLAGPRRHWAIQEAKRLSIPYIYVGDESYYDNNIDDINVNNLPVDMMNILYNLIDAYIVSSSSEGGPKSIVEASLCKCPVISTDVGFAADFIDINCIYNNTKSAKDLLVDLSNNINNFSYNLAHKNFKKTILINNKKSAISRLSMIYDLMP